VEVARSRVRINQEQFRCHHSDDDPLLCINLNDVLFFVLHGFDLTSVDGKSLRGVVKMFPASIILD